MKANRSNPSSDNPVHRRRAAAEVVLEPSADTFLGNRAGRNTNPPRRRVRIQSPESCAECRILALFLRALFRCDLGDAQLLHGAGPFDDDTCQMRGHADQFAIVRAGLVRMTIVHGDGAQQYSIA